MKAQQVSKGTSILPLTSALDGGEGSKPRSGLFTPGKVTLYLLYSRLDGKEGRSGWMGKYRSPPGFVTQTVQNVANRYTDYAVLAGCNLPVSPINKRQPLGLRQGIEHINLFGSAVCLRTTGHKCILGDQRRVLML
jgi:hypothetical protein